MKGPQISPAAIEQMTTRAQISEWFDHGKDEDFDYMIVACDTFDYSDYPIFCTAAEVKAKHDSHNGVNMQRVMEVYDLHTDKDEQMAERRTFRIPKE